MESLQMSPQYYYEMTTTNHGILPTEAFENINLN